MRMRRAEKEKAELHDCAVRPDPMAYRKRRYATTDNFLAVRDLAKP